MPIPNLPLDFCRLCGEFGVRLQLWCGVQDHRLPLGHGQETLAGARLRIRAPQVWGHTAILGTGVVFGDCGQGGGDAGLVQGFDPRALQGGSGGRLQLQRVRTIVSCALGTEEELMLTNCPKALVCRACCESISVSSYVDCDVDQAI